MENKRTHIASRFSPMSISLGDSRAKLLRLDWYLREFGYLPKDAPPRFVVDAQFLDALARYQHTHGLERSAGIDPKTAQLLNLPRCGNTDEPTILAGFGARYVPIGSSWFAKARTLTYGFANATPDISGDAERQAVRTALATWAQVIPLDFIEVPIESNPALKFGWYSGSHGDTSSFDGGGGVLAHAYYPPPLGGTFTGNCHFDEAEVWGIGTGGGAIDLETVALHEVGHLLGLAHSTVSGSVMAAYYSGVRRSLSADDVAGIQSLYGKPGPALRVRVHLQNTGDATFRDSEFAGSRGQARRLEGFQVELSTAVPGLSLEYMVHLQNSADTGWIPEGQFVGTRGEGRRLEGFAIRLTGPSAPNYDVFYMAHLEGIGDTGLHSNGDFCGTRGQARRCEGILVSIQPK